MPRSGSNQPVYSCQIARTFHGVLPYSSVSVSSGGASISRIKLRKLMPAFMPSIVRS